MSDVLPVGAVEAALFGVLAEVPVKPKYSPDDHPLDTFYIPMLSVATAYDRAVGYWSATELSYAAQGVSQFIAHGGRMRLIVGAQLSDRDVRAVLDGAPLEDALAARLLADPGLEGEKIVAQRHLQVIAWMAATGRLEIKVGVPVADDGTPLTYAQSGKYFHTKYGVFTDGAGNKVAFNGSNNATVAGWVSNHESFDVYPSWKPEVWAWNGESTVQDFDAHWDGRADAGWAILDLPEAVRQHLIMNAPTEPPIPEYKRPPTPESVDWDAATAELQRLARAPMDHSWTAVGTAPAAPLPHQAHLIDRVVGTFPRGYLFADEVGLGKTIEVGLAVRELFLSGQAERVLLLVPASVLVQWQEELREKIGLTVPRYDKGTFKGLPGERPDGTHHDGDEIPVPAGTNPWSAFPIVLASSHLARRRSRQDEVLAGGPWDVVVVDEAHHARRRGSKPTDTPNALLSLLTKMRAQGSWRALYLASATPMQMNAHEAWDLISLLNLPGRWGESAIDFIRYFEHLRGLHSDPENVNWSLLSSMVADYFTDSPPAIRNVRLERDIEDDLGFAGAGVILGLDHTVPAPEKARNFSAAEINWADQWLRAHTPMRDRVFRNTRQTLRDYQAAGIIKADVIIPTRHVDDAFIEMDPAEAALYARIDDYIRFYYNAYKGQQATQALGFIMTVYRRRLTSSFQAIRASLQRRLEVLRDGKAMGELLADDDQGAIDDALFDVEELDARPELIQGEIQAIEAFLHDLSEITGEDTKAQRLSSDIAQALNTYDSVVVFTQYTDTMDYVRNQLVQTYNSVGCYSGRGGEIYNPSTGNWDQVSKSVIKEQFREGSLRVLLGTDSMSEGLNLQTSGRLINYDMPWNLMRVEQRIGRVDRIGARYPDIRVSNYFYAGTVEQRVYEGIAEDYTDFTDIVGAAQPVLAAVESAIEQLTLAADRADPATIQARVEDIKRDIATATRQAVKVTDAEDHHIEPPPSLVGEVTLETLRDCLTSNPITRDKFVPDEGHPGVFRLTMGEQQTLVTFDRELAEASKEGAVLLTYGEPLLTRLLP